MPQTVLTLTQALQLVGLAPCLFLAAMLATLSLRNPQGIVPAFYFAALACSFALPLTEILGYGQKVAAGLLFGESTLAAFSFLLIIQFLLGRVPPGAYWLVLAIPLIGGGQLIYATTLPASELCEGDRCLDVASIRTLYNVFASSMVFLLLVYYASRASGVQTADIHRAHKYWLVVVLILSHLLVLAVDLARMSDHLSHDDAFFTETVLRLMFIYLVITSLFRVFYPTLAAQAVPTLAEARRYDPAQDAAHVETVKRLLEVDRAYREMRLNRAALAKKVGIGEHHLSRVINHAFGRNFNELVNSYRIEEAKIRLKNETTQVTVIAFEVGFNSIASFNRVFKEKVGLSPTEFREKGEAA
jgi:AraC-like DNA-binding protein